MNDNDRKGRSSSQVLSRWYSRCIAWIIVVVATVSLLWLIRRSRPDPLDLPALLRASSPGRVLQVVVDEDVDWSGVFDANVTVYIVRMDGVPGATLVWESNESARFEVEWLSDSEVRIRQAGADEANSRWITEEFDVAGVNVIVHRLPYDGEE